MQGLNLPKILIIEPYYDGSHRHFLQGLQGTVEAEYTLLSLPARKWKMRMQLSAPWFAEQLREFREGDRFFDTVLCSTFVDVAVLRALVQQLPGWNRETRFCTYFHENQFVYPGRINAYSLHQFTSINFMTAVTSDSVAFNSCYNRDTFLDASLNYVKKASDMSLSHIHRQVREKSIVLYPGMNYQQIDSVRQRKTHDVPVIVWNHRWEYDKNPEEFFRVLHSLQKKGVPFELILLGQSFKKRPDCFEDARQTFRDRIVHYGFAESHEDYAKLLQRGDVVISTSNHEFFGISILEAVRAGCYPLLPKRLSYPELFPAEYLYRDGELETKLEKVLQNRNTLSEEKSFLLTDQYDWKNTGDRYRAWLFNGNG